jgi:hypothetical protein
MRLCRGFRIVEKAAACYYVYVVNRNREDGLRLGDYLSVPYLLQAATIEIAPGSWIRRVAYPELPGCAAESLVLEDALVRLERMRIEMLVRMVGEGRAPPVPRPPLKGCDPAWIARQAGLGDDIVALIDRDRDSTAAPPTGA